MRRGTCRSSPPGAPAVSPECGFLPLQARNPAGANPATHPRASPLPPPGLRWPPQTIGSVARARAHPGRTRRPVWHPTRSTVPQGQKGALRRAAAATGGAHSGPGRPAARRGLLWDAGPSGFFRPRTPGPRSSAPAGRRGPRAAFPAPCHRGPLAQGSATAARPAAGPLHPDTRGFFPASPWAGHP